MHRITMFMLGESVANVPTTNGTNPQLVNPVVVLRPAYIPGNFSFGVALGVQGVDSNANATNKIRFEILSPSGEVVQNSPEITLPPHEEDLILPLEYQGLALTLDIRNMRIPEEGLYKFCFYVNGQLLNPQEFAVYRGVM